jgi:hypothetical protein
MSIIIVGASREESHLHRGVKQAWVHGLVGGSRQGENPDDALVVGARCKYEREKPWWVFPNVVQRKEWHATHGQISSGGSWCEHTRGG